MKTFPRILLAGLLAVTGVNALAQTGSTAADAVTAALQQGSAPETIIRSLTGAPYDLSLADATVTAMNAGGDASRIDFVKAGVAAAGNLPQAQEVVNAVRSAAGEGSAEAAAATEALQSYVRLMPQPDIYQDDYSPTGGAAVQGGGTVGPGGPGGGPVSPAS